MGQGPGEGLLQSDRCGAGWVEQLWGGTPALGRSWKAAPGQPKPPVLLPCREHAGGLPPPVAPLAVDPAQPELCYLPAFFSGPQLADAALTVAGVTLPLHSQLLAMRVGACHAAVVSGGAGAAAAAREEGEQDDEEEEGGGERPWDPVLRVGFARAQSFV